MSMVYRGEPMKQAAGSSRPGLTEDDRESLRPLMRCLEAFRAIRPTMPLQHAVSFLLVALDEGQMVQTYADKIGVTQSVMTRHLSDIGEMDRYHEPGYGLVYQKPDVLDRRKHLHFLTAEGKALAHRLIRALA